jgi:rubredoxin
MTTAIDWGQVTPAAFRSPIVFYVYDAASGSYHCENCAEARFGQHVLARLLGGTLSNGTAVSSDPGLLGDYGDEVDGIPADMSLSCDLLCDDCGISLGELLDEAEHVFPAGERCTQCGKTRKEIDED